MLGYNLPETREYYQKHLGRARHDVAHANANGQGDRIKAQNFEWMLLDARAAEVYGADQPAWLGDVRLSEWIDHLMEAAALAVPADGLRVRDSGGAQLSVGGREPVKGEILEAVTHNLR